MIRVPGPGWRPEGLFPQSTKISKYNVTANSSVATPQFWLRWLALALNVTVGSASTSRLRPCSKISSAVRLRCFLPVASGVCSLHSTRKDAPAGPHFQVLFVVKRHKWSSSPNWSDPVTKPSTESFPRPRRREFAQGGLSSRKARNVLPPTRIFGFAQFMRHFSCVRRLYALAPAPTRSPPPEPLPQPPENI